MQKRFAWFPILVVAALVAGFGTGLATTSDQAPAQNIVADPTDPTTAGSTPPESTTSAVGTEPTTGSDPPSATPPVDVTTVTVPVEVPKERNWVRVESPDETVPTPFPLNEQTALLTPDLDGDGIADIVLAGRGGSESVQWFRRTGSGWVRHRIEPGELAVEAGGVSFDIDGDGDLDIVFGNDFSGNEVWWWENPSPNFDPEVGWTRRTIKDDGGNMHHDMVAADLDGDGTPELIFWNQRADPPTLWSAEIPTDPLLDEPWSMRRLVIAGSALEGLDAGDLDLDGDIDLVAGGTLMFNQGDFTFEFNELGGELGQGRAMIADVVPGGRPEIVFDSGDSVGRLALTSWDGTAWITITLIERTVNGHSLDLADADGDGDIDILTAEMRLNAGDEAVFRLMINDGAGTFTEKVLALGVDNHESKLADIDGDGDIDIVVKPFNTDVPRLDVWLNAPLGSALSTWTRHVIDPDWSDRAVFVLTDDLDADGDPDVVSGQWWYRNPGDPGLLWVRTPLPEPVRQAAILADFDSDGDLDVFATQGVGSEPNSKLAWAQNDGTGNFVPFSNIPDAEGDFLQGAVAARFVIDQPIQILLSWHEPDRGVQSLTIPDDPTSAPWLLGISSQLSQDEALSVGDIDEDGDLDVMLGNVWVRNDVIAGTPFTLHSPDTGMPDRNELIDMDGDGDLDVVVTYEDAVNGRVAWYEQPEVSTDPWIEHVIAAFTLPLSLDVGDLDRDGDIDIVVGEHSIENPDAMGLFILENGGDNETWTRHTVFIGDEHHDGAKLVDIDGDGDLDIVSIGWTHNRVMLYENRSIP